MKGKRILVTGSSGSIGTALCEKLISEGYDVIPVDWKTNKWNEQINAKTLHLDLRDVKIVKDLPEADIVVHLAANARVHDLLIKPSLATDNILSTLNILEYARQRKIPGLIFASSREVYGDAVKPSYQESDARIENCVSAYAASKIAGEALVHSYRKCHGVNAVILRLSNVYGRYDEYDRVIPQFIRKMLIGEDVMVFGSDKILDFLYIDDAVKALHLCIEKFDSVHGNTLNIGTGRGVKLIKIAELIRTALQCESRIITDENRKGELTHYVADISMAKKILDFVPDTSVEEGVEKSIKWYRSMLKR